MNQDAFLLIRWWNDKPLQTRLFLIFTTLFVFCAVVLFFFLTNLIRMIDLSHQSQNIFDRNYQLYQLRTLTRTYELNLNQVEINASASAEQELSLAEERIDKSIASLRLLLPEKDLASLEEFKAAKDQLSPMISEIIQAIHAQDQMTVDMVDNASPPLFEAMYGAIDAIYGRSAAELEAISTEAKKSSQNARVVTLLVIMAVLLLGLVAALIMHAQIDQPLDQLTRVTRDLLEGKFQAADLEQLARRSDEIGLITSEFITMAAALESHAAQLQQGADEIRVKIR